MTESELNYKDVFSRKESWIFRILGATLYSGLFGAAYIALDGFGIPILVAVTIVCSATVIPIIMSLASRTRPRDVEVSFSIFDQGFASAIMVLVFAIIITPVSILVANAIHFTILNIILTSCLLGGILNSMSVDWLYMNSDDDHVTITRTTERIPDNTSDSSSSASKSSHASQRGTTSSNEARETESDITEIKTADTDDSASISEATTNPDKQEESTESKTESDVEQRLDDLLESVADHISQAENHIEEGSFDKSHRKLNRSERVINQATSLKKKQYTEPGEEIREERKRIETLKDLVGRAQMQHQRVQKALQSGYQSSMSVDSAKSELSKLQDTIEEIDNYDRIDVSSDNLRQTISNLEEEIEKKGTEDRLSKLFGTIGGTLSGAEESFKQGDYDEAKKKVESVVEKTETAFLINDEHELGKGKAIAEKRSRISDIRDKINREHKEAKQASSKFSNLVESVTDSFSQAEAHLKEGKLRQAHNEFETAEEAINKLSSLNERHSLEREGDIETNRERVETVIDLVEQARTQRQYVQRAIQYKSYDSAESELSKVQDTLEQIAAHDGIDIRSDDLQQSVNQFEDRIATGRADRRLTGLFRAIGSSRSSAEDCFEEGSYDRARRRLNSAFESVEKAASINQRHDLGKDEQISEKRDQIEELRSEFEQKSREEHSKHITKAEEAISRGIEQREANKPAGAVDAFTEAQEHYDKALKLAEAYELPELWETEQRHSMVTEYLEVAREELEERRHATRNELEQALEAAESFVSRAEQYDEVNDHVSARESLSRAIDHLDEATQLLSVEGVTDQQQSRYNDLVDRAETVQKNLPDEEDSGRYRNQDLVESLQRLATKLGESPRLEFVNEYGGYPADTYLDAFGSWPEALAAANLDSIDESARDRRSYSRVDILDELVRLSNELGHPPSRTEMNRKGNISSTTVKNRFRDWDTAIELANIGKKDSLSDEVAETSGIDSDSETPVETVSNQPTPEDDSDSDKKDQLIKSSDATTDVDISSETFAELSAFRRDCLVVINGMDTPKGLEIKDELEQYYDETVNHGRLYPNLETLEEKGMIEKLELDGRSNGYLLTEFGREHVKQRRQWEAEIRDKLASPDSKPVDFDSNSVAVSDAKHDSSSVVWTELKDDTPSDGSFATIENITEDGRLSRAIAVSVCEISDPSGDRKQSSLRVEDTDGNRCQLNIWKTHNVEVTWTTGHWYVLQHARGKVWTNERGDTEQQLSSTDDLCVEHVGEDLLSPDEIESSTHPESTNESHTTSATTDEKSGDAAEAGGILDEVVGEFEELSESEEN